MYLIVYVSIVLFVAPIPPISVHVAKRIGGDSDQMTLGSEPALDALTQHPPPEQEAETATIFPMFLTDELKSQFQRNWASVPYDGLTFDSDEVQRPQVFFIRPLVGLM